MDKLYYKILKILHKADNEYISGEKISTRLGVSRTTVWKYVKKMRENGYKIESFTKKGYKLLDVPEAIAAEEMKLRLNTEIIGSEIYVYQSVDSTNNKAKELAREGAEDGSVIVAEKQTAGKGRLGRRWFSERGNGLWLSIIVKPDMSPARAPYLTIAAALALKSALENYDFKQKASELAIQIKWPNDILLAGRKLSGILSEMSADFDNIKFAVVGIGINVNQEEFPGEIKSTAVSLRQYMGEKVDRYILLELLLEYFEVYYKLLLQGKYNNLLTKWKQELNLSGERVKVLAGNDVYYGEVIDISLRGELVIKTKDGIIHSFWAGDVSLREGDKL